MDNEKDYIELHRLLAKCKFNLVRDELELCNKGINTKELTMSEYYEKKIKQIDEFIVDIPIIIKGGER